MEAFQHSITIDFDQDRIHGMDNSDANYQNLNLSLETSLKTEISLFLRPLLKTIFMAHHKSSIKRIRQTAKKRLQNRLYAKTARNLVSDIRAMKDKKEAQKLLPDVISKLDKLAKRNQIHWKKAANLKSSLTLHVNKLQ